MLKVNGYDREIVRRKIQWTDKDTQKAKLIVFCERTVIILLTHPKQGSDRLRDKVKMHRKILTQKGRAE